MTETIFDSIAQLMVQYKGQDKNVSLLTPKPVTFG